MDSIVRIIQRSWEDQDAGYIYDTCAPGCVVHDDSGAQGFATSHRYINTGHHQGAWQYGPATGAEQLLHSYSVKSRDNARTPMQWDDSEQAGFTTGTPWLPVTPNKDTVNVAAAVADPDSVFHHYRRLIALRHGDEAVNPVVREGVFELLEAEHEQLFAYTRTLVGVGSLLVLANLSSTPCALPSSSVLPRDGEPVLTTHGEGSAQELAPWESRALWLG